MDIINKNSLFIIVLWVKIWTITEYCLHKILSSYSCHNQCYLCRLYGNPICKNSSETLIINLCRLQSINLEKSKQETSTAMVCGACPTEKNYEYNPSFSDQCFCAVPLGVGLRLKSPGVRDFHPYENAFKIDLTSLLQLFPYQLYIENYIWEVGPRLNMHLKLFPSNTSLFNMSEVVRLRHVLAGWEITLLDVFGPYELLNFTLGSYEDGIYTWS